MQTALKSEIPYPRCGETDKRHYGLVGVRRPFSRSALVACARTTDGHASAARTLALVTIFEFRTRAVSSA